MIYRRILAIIVLIRERAVEQIETVRPARLPVLAFVQKKGHVEAAEELLVRRAHALRSERAQQFYALAPTLEPATGYAEQPSALGGLPAVEQHDAPKTLAALSYNFEVVTYGGPTQRIGAYVKPERVKTFHILLTFPPVCGIL